VYVFTVPVYIYVCVCVCTVCNRGVTHKSNVGRNMSTCSLRTSSSFPSMKSLYCICLLLDVNSLWSVTSVKSLCKLLNLMVDISHR